MSDHSRDTPPTAPEREVPSIAEQSLSPEVTVTVVCTDKKSHRPLTIRVFRKYSFGWRLSVPRERSDGGGYDLRPVAGRDGLCRLECRRCGRDTRITAGKLTMLLDGLTANAVESLDLSDIPF
jgi:hypothetical protein